MATYTCAFTVPAGNSATGSRLTGNFGTKPTLQNGDQLQVTVTFAGQSAPTSLNGYMTITPLPTDNDQMTPSPFLNASGNPLCFKPQSGVSAANKVFTFAALSYGGGYPGKYELTFVAEDANSLVQWSEDPEFDTGD